MVRRNNGGESSTSLLLLNGSWNMAFTGYCKLMNRAVFKNVFSGWICYFYTAITIKQVKTILGFFNAIHKATRLNCWEPALWTLMSVDRVWLWLLSKKKHCNFRLFTATFEPRHENKNCSACPEDQLELF